MADLNEARALLGRLAEVEKERDEAREAWRNESREATLWTIRAEAAEAELARLRAPAGDVGEVVAGLMDRVAGRNWMVDLDKDAADLLLRQAGEIARLREATEREIAGTRADTWTERTARIAAEASLREAGEVIESLIVPREPWMDDHDQDTRMSFFRGLSWGEHKRASDFLAKLETKP
jgi:hypothetical protein